MQPAEVYGAMHVYGVSVAVHGVLNGMALIHEM